MSDTTDWTKYGLADIWDMVKRDDFNQNHGHIQTWDKMQVLCQHQAQSLRAAAAKLTEHWPPDRSEASAMFAQRMEGLAAVFAEASEAASRNSWTLNGVSSGLAETHGGISGLLGTWWRYQAAQIERVRAARAYLGPIGSSLPEDYVLFMSNQGAAKVVLDMQGAPQVPTGWKQDLDKQARALMTQADREIVEARPNVTKPPVLRPGIGGIDWPDRQPSSDGGAGGGGGVFTGLVSSAPPGMPGRSPFDDNEPLPGSHPILDGANVPLSQQTPQIGGSHSGGLPAAVPTGGSLPWVATPMGPALAPGGVIGGGERGVAGTRPGTGGAVGSGMVPMGAGGGRPAATGAKSGGFVAPPGGLIGGRPSGKGGPSGLVGAPTSQRRRRTDDDDGWAVASGVPGVLTPDPEPDQHDPGPGVIGIDR